MKPKPTNVRVEWAILCEAATIDAGGYMTLRKIFHGLVVPKLPAALNAAIGLSLLGPPNKKIHLSYTLVDPEGRVYGEPKTHDWTTGATGHSEIAITLERIPLERYGEHHIQVRVDGILLGVARLFVFEDAGSAGRVH